MALRSSQGPAVKSYGAVDREVLALPPDVDEERGATGAGAAGDEGAGFTGTVANIMKICVGTGVLALPYAFARGGLAFSVAVLVAIALWNQLSVQWLLRSEEAVKEKLARAGEGERRKLEGVGMYSKIAYVALGTGGIQLIDGMLVVTIYGVCVAYMIFCAQLLGDSPMSLGRLMNTEDEFYTHLFNCLACTVAVTPPSLYRDVSFLVPYSKAGLGVLGFVLACMFYMGFSQGGDRNVPLDAHTLLPTSFNDFAAYFGVAVFCFGGTPLMFPVKDGMRRSMQHRFKDANCAALMGAALLYAIVGCGLGYIFQEKGGVPQNVLQSLPPTTELAGGDLRTLLATCMRLGYLAVTLLSFPLTFVALAGMVEDRVSAGSSEPAGHFIQRELIRLLLLAAVALFAILIPEFGLVVSLLGCFSVTILSFALPPFFLMRICNEYTYKLSIAATGGLIVCVCTTIQTGAAVVEKLLHRA
uniref:Amino acid transporter transmembrane domain-containing protein n=1 Tax=Phaeomonas parva TaxID=124430 RepID=A0A7S1XNH0_9STRA|mmetsp:Transcript_24632/g.77207  ORF Transcript_24632/g.77207 Transcript_24632/m.77207 type:complete len:471 (+) Transcript_24632:292-1704(+)